MNRIRIFDYLDQYRSLKEEIAAAIDRALCSGELILGEEVEAFEREFTEYLGGTGKSVGVASVRMPWLLP